MKTPIRYAHKVNQTLPHHEPRQLNIYVCINIHMVVGLCTKYMFSQSCSRPLLLLLLLILLTVLLDSRTVLCSIFDFGIQGTFVYPMICWKLFRHLKRTTKTKAKADPTKGIIKRHHASFPASCATQTTLSRTFFAILSRWALCLGHTLLRTQSH